MNKFLAVVVLLAFSSVRFGLSSPQKNMLVKNQGIFETPQILWKLYDVLSYHPSCKDVKIISLPAQFHMRHQKVYVRAEIPSIVGTKFQKALLRLEFRDLPKDKENGSAVYRADIGTKDARIRGSRSQEAQDTLASGSDVEMSFGVTDLLRPTLQLRRRQFTAHLKILPAKRLMKSGSLKVFLIIQEKDTTCSDFSLPDLQGGSTLSSLILNASDPSGVGPAQCRRKNLVVTARDVPVSFTVLRPVEIDVGDCEGRCDVMPGRSLFSNHAALKAHYQKAGGSPCCAPTGFKPVLMMGQEPFSNFVSILEVPNMRISSCACM